MSLIALWHLVAIILSAVSGTTTRHLIQSIFNKSQIKPYGTFIVNTLGCFIMGIITEIPIGYIKQVFYQSFVVGFCASFSTFSSIILEIYLMIRMGFYIKAVIYALSSFFIGLIAIWFGKYLIHTALQL
jgi:fluoride exporter